jgi:uncharacterized protein YaiI (UPF0178 family)
MYVFLNSGSNALESDGGINDEANIPATTSTADTKQDTKQNTVLTQKEPPKKKRKSSIEKSLEVAFNKFKETSNEEFERYLLKALSD